MFMTIYKRAANILIKKPWKLWGISLLSVVLSTVLSALCGSAIPLLGTIVGLLITTAMTIIFLKGYRGEDVEVSELFACFKDWNTIKRVILGMGWMTLWIFIWSLIPIAGIVFAIIRSYEYRLTPYILMLEPDIPITEAIKVSKQRTQGYKLQMWLADFVFAIICIAIGLILALLSLIPILGILFALIAIVFAISVALFSTIFLGLVQAAFYEEINGSVKICTGCGSVLPQGAAFCQNCGKPVE